ncbi:MAG: putative transport system permease protein [Pseudonocardiales bacterium]|nr:putative transport system permease protein [Pseudonocardiales bacterium]
MIHLLLVRLRVNRLRVIALMLGIAAATTAFVVLTGQVAEQRLALRGRVSAQASPDYDILVRPAGSRTALEEREGLVRANFLSGQFGGITLAQWHRIQQLAGVQVAAPIAMVGYVLQTVQIPLDLTDRLGPGDQQLFTASITRKTARGLTSFAEPAISYSYVSRAPVHVVGPGAGVPGVLVAGPDGRQRLVCPVRPKSRLSPLAVRSKRTGTCWSRQNGPDGGGTGPLPAGHAGIVVQWTFPFLLAAIDPAQEAGLSGLDTALGQGSYLPERGTVPGRAGPGVPVLMAEQGDFDDRDEVSIERLPPAATAKAATGLRIDELDALLENGGGTEVRHLSISAATAYRQLLSSSLGAPEPRIVDSYWTSGPVRYRTDPDGTLRPIPVTNPPSVWRAPVQYQASVLVPPDAGDTSFRRLSQHPARAVSESPFGAPRLAVVGTFDQSRLNSVRAGGSAELLGGYRTQPLAPADPASRERLHAQPLAPDSNPAGYLLPAPTLFTSLDAASVFTDPAAFDNVSRSTAPISAVRVRVAGVRGTDPVSRERVRLVAEAIAGATGLDVDVTVGSAPTSRQLVLPAGAAGRPALRLSEQWQRKGVVVQALRAIDRKSALLFALVLVVCGVFVANAAGAAARSPRMELSTLSCLGWTRGQLMRLLLGEMAVIGAGAGLLGALVAVVGGRFLGTPVSTGRALAAVPAALAITLLAAAWPVWRASVPVPLPGMPATGGTAGGRDGRLRRLRGLSQLAYRNLRAEPGRTGLGMAAVGVGSAGLTLLLAITVAFRGSVVGSVLGDAISLQARRVDYLAVVLTLLLAAVAVADVSYLNMRERREDLSLLRAVGWTSRQLVRLIVAEGALLGLAGALAGSGLGLAVTAVLADSVPGSLWLLAGLTALAGTLLSVLATVLAALSLPLLVRTPSLTAE